MSGARISRVHLDDDSLARAIKMLGAQLGILGTFTHRYREMPEVGYELKRDDDAVCDVLGILLNEQRHRRFEDEDTAALDREVSS